MHTRRAQSCNPLAGKLAVLPIETDEHTMIVTVDDDKT